MYDPSWSAQATVFPGQGTELEGAIGDQAATAVWEAFLATVSQLQNETAGQAGGLLWGQTPSGDDGEEQGAEGGDAAGPSLGPSSLSQGLAPPPPTAAGPSPSPDSGSDPPSSAPVTASPTVQDAATAFLAAYPGLSDAQRLAFHSQLRAVELASGGAATELSLHYFAANGSLAGTAELVASGFDAIPAALAAGLDIALAAPVAAIHHADTAATVWLENGTALAAQYVVATLPLGVLQAGSVSVDPPFSATLLNAISRLGVGPGAVLALWFDEVRG